MRKPLLNILLLNIPLFVCIAIMVPYSIDSGPAGDPLVGNGALFVFRLIPLAMILAVIQVVIWLRMAVRDFGWRRTVLGGAGILVMFFASRNLVDLWQTRQVSREVVVASQTLYRGSYEDFMFTVSPHGQWLIYARESGQMKNSVELPEIVLRELDTGHEKILDVASVPEGRYFTVAEDIVRALDEPYWRESSVCLLDGRRWLEIDLDSAQVRALAPKRAPSRRPLAKEVARHLILDRGQTRLNHAAVAWDGETRGKYVYAAFRSRTPWRKTTEIKRAAGDDPWEHVATRRGLFADWGVFGLIVSPDGRFVAYTGRRDHLIGLYLSLIPPFSMVPSYRDYLFVLDTQTGQEYDLGEVDGVRSPQWSRDSRSFYFAELNPWRERKIREIRFSVEPSAPSEGRLAWQPPANSRGHLRNAVVQTRSVSLRLSDPYEDWTTHTIGVMSFKYPAHVLSLEEKNGVARLEHRDGTSLQWPAGGGRKTQPPTGFSMTIGVVNRSCDELVPEGTPFGRPTPGLGFNTLTRSYRVVTRERDQEVAWWYRPLHDGETMVVSRPGMQVSPEKRVADRIFAMIASSIDIGKEY